MDIFEVMKNRRSIRHYKDEPVSAETLKKVLDAARIAPSWKNTQHWHYIVIADKDLKLQLCDAARTNPTRNSYENAAYYIVQCADGKKAEDWEGKQFFMTDMGLSMMQLMLAAYAEGLGTCYIGAFPEQPVKDLLGIPDDISVTALTPLGVSAEEVSPRPRKEMKDMVSLNGWDKPFDL